MIQVFGHPSLITLEEHARLAAFCIEVSKRPWVGLWTKLEETVVFKTSVPRKGGPVIFPSERLQYKIGLCPRRMCPNDASPSGEITMHLWYLVVWHGARGVMIGIQNPGSPAFSQPAGIVRFIF